MELRKDTVVRIAGYNYSDAGMCCCFCSAYTTVEHINLAWAEMDRLCEEGVLPARWLEGGAVFAEDENGNEVCLEQDDYKEFLISKETENGSVGKYLYKRKEDLPDEWFDTQSEEA